MSSFKFKQLNRSADTKKKRCFAVLRDYLQLNSIEVADAAESIVDILPDNEPGGRDVDAFEGLCIEIAGQIPYMHPAHVEFASLLEYLSHTTVFGKLKATPVRTLIGSVRHMTSMLIASGREISSLASLSRPGPALHRRHEEGYVLLA